MKLEEIVGSVSSNDAIKQLKSKRNSVSPDVDVANRAIDPSKHDINNKVLRPDKNVKTTDSDGSEISRIEKVARVSVALQKLIIKRAVSFCFGYPVAYNATPDNEKQQSVLKAFKRILHDNKMSSFDRKVARSVFGYKECAELWYPVEKEHGNYGFNSKHKLRCALWSPKDGNALYPYFDETGDMVAFSRAFSRVSEDNKRTEYFEMYTDEEHWLWSKGDDGYQLLEGYPKIISVGKIPIVYGHQEHFETEDVDSLIDRLEKLLSNFADTNDYHASPKIFVTGQINGWSQKGESGAVIEGEEGSSMQYVSWQSAPESVKLEIKTLLELIYTITQTPDISFESVKGLGEISGVALKLLFMDAHLKVQDKKEVFDDYLQRRVNVIKAYIAKFNTSLEYDVDTLEIEPEITPYMLTNEIDELNYWITANGNKPLVSHKASVVGANITQDAEKDYEQIQEEASRENSFTIGEPIEA